LSELGRSATGETFIRLHRELPAIFLPNFRSFVNGFILDEKYQHGSKSYSLLNDRPSLLPPVCPRGGKAPRVVDVAPTNFRCHFASSSWYPLHGRLRMARR
jgi:hypothetical protein